jgi:hypothetical protein
MQIETRRGKCRSRCKLPKLAMLLRNSMPTPEPIRLTAGPLVLTFEWHNDRFAHRVTLATDAQSDEAAPLLASMEGSQDDVWPDSPPLQECHVESRPDGRQVALLVGRAGRSHWSLSVLSDPVAGSLLFEVACRFSGEPNWLGSRYELFRPAEPAFQILLEVLEGPDRGLVTWSGLVANYTRITAPTSADPGVRTVQWSYLVRSTSAPTGE